MNILDEIFSYLTSKIGSKSVYLVGGSTRDFLLKRDFTDFDFATTLTPKELRSIFNDADYHFAKYGITNIKYKGYHITLATMRKETAYVDSRHPSEILFIKDINVDYLRRDFTINSIYMDSDKNIIDPANGQIDLKNRTIRMIGDIKERIEEDPLRILRAIRFKYILGFSIEPKLNIYINNNLSLLKKINKDKITMELKKCNQEGRIYIEELLKEVFSN